MKLTERVFLVGSGRFGFSISSQFDCHVYLIDGGSELALIDAGVGLEVERILANFSADGFDPLDIGKVLLTHVHADHAGGAADLKERTNAAVAIHEAEAELLEAADEDAIGLPIAREDGYYPDDYHMTPCRPDIVLTDGQELSVGDLNVSVVHCPGHSKGAVCYAVSDGGTKHLFSGDTVFFDGEIGLLNCVGSSLEDYRANVGKLTGLGIDVLLPGHLSVVLSGGQRHLDTAVENLRRLMPPPNAF